MRKFFLFIGVSSMAESGVLVLLQQELVLPFLSPRCVWGLESALQRAVQSFYTCLKAKTEDFGS